MTDENDMPLTERVPAPEILVDGYASTAIVNGVVKFTFFSIVHDPVGGDSYRNVVLRMSTPLPAAMGVHEALGRFLDQIKQMGHPALSDAQEPVHGAH